MYYCRVTFLHIKADDAFVFSKLIPKTFYFDKWILNVLSIHGVSHFSSIKLRLRRIHSHQTECIMFSRASNAFIWSGQTSLLQIRCKLQRLTSYTHSHIQNVPPISVPQQQSSPIVDSSVSARITSFLCRRFAWFIRVHSLQMRGVCNAGFLFFKRFLTSLTLFDGVTFINVLHSSVDVGWLAQILR